MDFPKQIKDIVYKLLQEPTLDNFREFLRGQTGEHNSIDFKSEWISDDKLAKEILAIANTQGGFIVFGVSENEDKSTKIDGLSQIKDHAQVSNEIKQYISSDLKYDIYDFSFDSSEYSALEGKHFQMLVVEDTPEHIPFMCKKESTNVKSNMVYVRRGTACEIASQEELLSIINRRINYLHPSNSEPLQLDAHLEQLEELYKHIKKEKVFYQNTASLALSKMLSSLAESISFAEKKVEENPLYPEEEYEEFISRMIAAKKKKIERFLDLY